MVENKNANVNIKYANVSEDFDKLTEKKPGCCNRVPCCVVQYNVGSSILYSTSSQPVVGIQIVTMNSSKH